MIDLDRKIAGLLILGLAIFTLTGCDRSDEGMQLITECKNLIEQGGYANAITSCTEGLIILPNHPEGLFNRGKAYLFAGRTNEAIQDLQIATSISPDPNYKATLGEAYLVYRNYTKAIELFDSVIAADPANIRALALKAIAKYERGDVVEGYLPDVEAALKVDSKNLLMLGIRGMTYQKQKEYEKAIADMKIVLDNADKEIENYKKSSPLDFARLSKLNIQLKDKLKKAEKSLALKKLHLLQVQKMKEEREKKPQKPKKKGW